MAKATVLVIIYRGEKYVTVHENPSAARDALRAFMGRDRRAPDGQSTERATEARGSAFSISLNERERCKADEFFAGEGDLYLIAEADLSEIEAAVTRESG